LKSFSPEAHFLDRLGGGPYTVKKQFLMGKLITGHCGKAV